MEADLGLRDILLDGDPALRYRNRQEPKSGGAAVPPTERRTATFRPMSIVAKQSPNPATAEISFCSLYTRNSYMGVHELHEMTATNTYITSAAQCCFLTCLQVHNNNISSNFKNSNKINKLLLFKWRNRSYGQKRDEISVQLPAGGQLCNDCGQIVHTLVPPHQEV